MKNLLRRHSSGILLAPYGLLFSLFIIIPIVAAVVLSFTYFNTIQAPSFIGLDNYINLFTNDNVFMQKVLPNTIVYAVFGRRGRICACLFSGVVSGTVNPKPRTVSPLSCTHHP